MLTWMQSARSLLSALPSSTTTMSASSVFSSKRARERLPRTVLKNVSVFSNIIRGMTVMAISNVVMGMSQPWLLQREIIPASEIPQHYISTSLLTGHLFSLPPRPLCHQLRRSQAVVKVEIKQSPHSLTPRDTKPPYNKNPFDIHQKKKKKMATNGRRVMCYLLEEEGAYPKGK